MKPQAIYWDGMKRRPGKLVEVGDGLTASAPTFRAIDHPDLPYLLELEIGIDEGRAVCEALHVRRRPGGAPVTGQGIRKIPIAGIVREGGVVFSGARPGVLSVLSPDDRERAQRILGRRKTSRDVTPDVLRDVASVTRQALLEGESTMHAVANALMVSNPYARRLIQRSRDEVDPSTGEPYLERRKERGPR